MVEDTSKVKGFILSGNLGIWDHNGPVSMALRSRPTPNGETVNQVFTPLEHRGNGYATAIVSNLSQLILNDGKRFCTLYTDLSNPTSNKIYREIGYKPIADVVDINFA